MKIRRRSRGSGVYVAVFSSSPALTKPTVSLPNHWSMETPGTPTHRPPPRYHAYSSSVYSKMDARWGSQGIHHEPSRCRQTWSRRYLSYHVARHPYPFASYLRLLTAQLPPLVRRDLRTSQGGTWLFQTSFHHCVDIHPVERSCGHHRSCPDHRL